jgi:hypothetical protein
MVPKSFLFSPKRKLVVPGCTHIPWPTNLISECAHVANKSLELSVSERTRVRVQVATFKGQVPLRSPRPQPMISSESDSRDTSYSKRGSRPQRVQTDDASRPAPISAALLPKRGRPAPRPSRGTVKIVAVAQSLSRHPAVTHDLWWLGF